VPVTGPAYHDGMARSAGKFDGDGAIVVVNPEVDTSIEALQAWITEIEQAADWIELPVSAAELIGEDRRASGS